MAKHPRKLLWFDLPRGATIPINVRAPAEVLRFWQVVRLNPGDLFTGIVRSRELFSTWIHYLPMDKTHAPCLQEAGVECPLCPNLPRRYQAALAVYTDRPPHETRLLFLPRMAVRSCPDLELCTGADLVGRRLTAKRGPFKKSRVAVQLFERAALAIPEEKWVTAGEVLAQCLLVWGVRYRETGEVAERSKPAAIAAELYDQGEDGPGPEGVPV